MFFSPGMKCAFHEFKKILSASGHQSLGITVMRLNNEIEIIDSGHFQVDSVNTENLRVGLRVDVFSPGIEMCI